MNSVTLVLQAAGRGDKLASEELLPLVYNELRRLAALRMAREVSAQTLQPTALVHEAWMRLVSNDARSWENRAHFFGAACEAMRRILIERARRKSRIKHGGGSMRMDAIEIESLAQAAPDEKLLLINEALKAMELDHPERAKVVVLRYFGGLGSKEIAETMGISERTVDRHWLCAKNWLYSKLRSEFSFKS